jgi:hypothetical protein
MKMACWILFGFSVLLLACGVYSVFAGQEYFLLGLRPAAWWRAAMAMVIYAIALRLIGGEETVSA